MPYCSSKELIPIQYIFCPIIRKPHLAWRRGQKRYGLPKTHSQFMPREFTTLDTASSQSSHYNNLSNPSLIYGKSYVKSHDAVGSVHPCEKLHKDQCFHSTAMATCFSPWTGIPIRGSLFVSCEGNCPNKEINLGLTSKFSLTMPPRNFRVELEACYCRIK